MVGYSDSAKDAGRLRAGVGALPRAGRDRRRVRAARRAADAVPRPRRQRRPRRRPDAPRDSIAAARFDRRPLRVTEQGEMIQAQVRPRRTSPCARWRSTRPRRSKRRSRRRRRPTPEWRACMDGCPSGRARAYRDGRLRRPALRRLLSRRHARARAARHQHRQPAGAPARRRAASKACARSRGSSPGRRRGCCCRRGSASRTRSAARSRAARRRCCRRCTSDWPFFQSTLDLIEMVLAKADAPDRRASTIAGSCRRSCSRSARDLRRGSRAPSPRCSRVTGHRELLEANPVLRRSIDVRNPVCRSDQPGPGRAAAPRCASQTDRGARAMRSS